jgi:hypothetical protein
MERSSRAVVAVALWVGGMVTDCNQALVRISVTGLNEIQCAFCCEQCLKLSTYEPLQI